MEYPIGDPRPVDLDHPEKRLLFEFDHNIGSDAHKLVVFLRPNEVTTRETFWKFVVEEKGRLVAVVGGDLQRDDEGLLEFSAHASQNFSKSARDRRLHIPNTVGATIVELLNRGVLVRWYSDHGGMLSEDAIGLYAQRLPRDGRVDVVEPSVQTKYRYLVTKRQATSQTP